MTNKDDGKVDPTRLTEGTNHGFEGMVEDPSTRLVQDAIAGDEVSLQALWHEHRRWVAAVLLANKPRDADLDDLLQDVAATVVAKIGGVREPGAFKPWLRAVALNAAKTAGRKRSTRVAGVLRLIGIGAGKDEDTRSEASSASAKEEGSRLMRLAQDLPDGYREPLLMRCVQGMGYREIGEVMGLPETTIETRIARGRRMLRDLAESKGLGPDAAERRAAAGSTVRAESTGGREA